VFLDKYNNSMIIDLDMIAYVTPKSNGEQRWKIIYVYGVVK
jgi:hypothetical protein